MLVSFAQGARHAAEPVQLTELFVLTCVILSGCDTCLSVCAACVLFANSAFVQASILVASMTPIIYKFYR